MNDETDVTSQVLSNGAVAMAAKIEEEIPEGAVTTKKSLKKKKVTSGEVVGKDLILDTAHYVENLTKDAALDALRSVVETQGTNNFQMGGLLQRIYEMGWWDNGIYQNFKEFVEKEYGVGFRKAAYLMTIYSGLVNSGIKWEQVEVLGWTKLRELVAILTSDNVEEWVEKAKGMTVLQLIEHIKVEKAKALPEKEGKVQEVTEVAKVSTKTFKLHEDQLETVTTAIEKAKEDGNTEFDTVALEYICLRYLSDDLGKAVTTTKTKTLEQLMQDAGPEKVKDVFMEVFAGEDVTTKQQSIGDMFLEMGPEHVLTVFEKVWPNFDITVSEK
jgi:hypothetical protein